jgi:hypothetical protein
VLQIESDDDNDDSDSDVVSSRRPKRRKQERSRPGKPHRLSPQIGSDR